MFRNGFLGSLGKVSGSTKLNVRCLPAPRLLLSKPHLCLSSIQIDNVSVATRKSEAATKVPAGIVDDLNEEQRAAVLTEGSTARVKAGPGSGKTRVVVTRARYLISILGVDPSRILCITFTNKAARELKERLTGQKGGGGAKGGGAKGGAESGEGAAQGRLNREGTAPKARSSAAGDQQIEKESDGAAEDEAGAGPGPGSLALAAQQVQARTFHGLGAYVLRQCAADLMLSGLGLDSHYKILDENKSFELLKAAVEKVEELQAADRLTCPAHVTLVPLNDHHVVNRLAGRLLHKLPDIKTQLAAKGCFDEGTAIKDAVRLGLLPDSVPRGPPEGRNREEIMQKAKQFMARMRREEDDQGDLAVAVRWNLAQLQAYYTAYHRLLRANNAADFSDLITLPVRLLSRDSQLRDEWRARFAHILVDEFQDTDPAQYALLCLLRGPTTGLFVVGDPDQAIYGWRGAQSEYMSQKLTDTFPDTVSHTLATNYRSLPAIIHTADAVLCAKGTPELYSKPIAARAATLTASTRGSSRHSSSLSSAGKRLPGDIQYVVHNSPKDEARVIAERITQWARQGVALSEIAVLYRNRALSREIEEALTRALVPYTVVGGQPFWEYKDVMDTMAYMHVVADPLRSDVFLERILNTPTRGLGKAAVSKLEAAAKAAGSTLGALLLGDCCDPADPQLERRVTEAYTASGYKAPTAEAIAKYAPDVGAGHPLKGVGLTKTALAGAQGLRGLVSYLRWSASKGGDVRSLVKATLELSGYRAEVVRKASEQDMKAKPAKKVELEVAPDARLDMLLDVASDPDSWVTMEDAAAADPTQQPEKGLPGLELFLSHASMVTSQEMAEGGRRDRVRLTTLHSVKGLEYERVFMIGMEEDILPSRRAKMGRDAGTKLAEERRLCYVGITRAKDWLCMSRCEERISYGEKVQHQSSSLLVAARWQRAMS